MAHFKYIGRSKKGDRVEGVVEGLGVVGGGEHGHVLEVGEAEGADDRQYSITPGGDD